MGKSVCPTCILMIKHGSKTWVQVENFVNSIDFQVKHTPLKIKSAFCWDLKFVDFPTHKIHEIKCLTNKNDFAVTHCVSCEGTRGRRGSRNALGSVNIPPFFRATEFQETRKSCN